MRERDLQLSEADGIEGNVLEKEQSKHLEPGNGIQTGERTESE